MKFTHPNRICRSDGKRLRRELAAELGASLRRRPLHSVAAPEAHVLDRSIAERRSLLRQAVGETALRQWPAVAPQNSSFRRLVVVSNRLPIVFEADDGVMRVRAGSGGLITALAPVLRRWGGLWIGWPGPVGDDGLTVQRLLREFGGAHGFGLKHVMLTAKEQDQFYQGYSNEIIWPLFHDLQSQCNFVPEYWAAYLSVIQKFSDAVVSEIRGDDFIWVNDYHLMGLGRYLRRRGVSNKLGFFLHIPFPPPDLFRKLPWRTEVLEGLLAHDVVGFQTPHDLDNFSDCARALLPSARCRRRRDMLEITYAGHVCSVGAFPIGIDFDEFAVAAAAPSVSAQARHLRADMQDQQIILGLDRLDYTKGIPYRIRAFELALRRYPELHRAVTLLQVVIPSRESVPEYQNLKGQIEQLVSQVNGAFTQPGWVPIHHVFRSLERGDLLAYYRLADAALITPLKDGMNLVAKEYCACQTDGNGVLILSEFAGSAVQLGRFAVLVNPYDLDHVADAIRRAVLMTKAERGPAMGRMRGILRRQDVYWWVSRFLASCGVSRASDAPQRAADGAGAMAVTDP